MGVGGGGGGGGGGSWWLGIGFLLVETEEDRIKFKHYKEVCLHKASLGFG